MGIKGLIGISATLCNVRRLRIQSFHCLFASRQVVVETKQVYIYNYIHGYINWPSNGSRVG